MPTERRTDCGDYWLVEIGEPTVDDPSVWFNQYMEWKEGTAEYINAHARDAATAALEAFETYLELEGEELTLEVVSAQLTLLTQVIHDLIPPLVARLP